MALTGGEPLIEKKLPRIIRNVKASHSFIYLHVITNGSLLTEKKAEVLYEAGLDQVRQCADFAPFVH